MSDKLKKGFSLVEVIILFAVLAITLAASLPMLTKKTKPVPKPTVHGTYICYAIGDKKVRQEYYNAINRLGYSEDAAKCEFNVPRKANKFKVELYSAGAGGFEFAEIESKPDDSSGTVDFNMEKIGEFARGEQSLKSIFPSDKISYIPKNDEFANLLDGVVAKILNYTGDAGDGGTARAEYTLANQVLCAGYEALEEPHFYKDKGNEYMHNDNTRLQIQHFCRYKDVQLFNEKPAYARYLTSNGDGVMVVKEDEKTNWMIPTYTSDADMEGYLEQRGGEGGKGVTIVLDVTVNKETSLKTPRYIEKAHDNKYENTYPFLMYLSDIFNDTFGHGYYAIACKYKYGNILSLCAKGSPTSIISGYDYVEERSVTGIGAPNTDEKTSAGWTRVGDTPYYQLTASDGDSVKTWAGFRIPSFTGVVINFDDTTGANLTIQKTKAQGGKGGIVRVKTAGTAGDILINASSSQFPDSEKLAPDLENPQKAYDGITEVNASFKEDMLNANFAYIVFRGDGDYVKSEDNKEKEGYNWYADGSQNKPDEYNTQLEEEYASYEVGLMTPGLYNMRQYEYEYPSECNSYPECHSYPGVRLTSKLYSREYSLGNPGGAGQYRMFQISHLGKTCTATVPLGGKVISYDEFNKWSEDERNNEVQKREKALEVSISCSDSEGKVVFSQKLNGAKYNLEKQSIEYNWERPDKEEDEGKAGEPFTASPADKHTATHYKPRWSRIWQDINTLDDAGIGNGGDGTTVIDKCTIPKGTFDMYALLDGEILDEDDEKRHFHKGHDGKLGTYDCYPDETRTFPQIKKDDKIYTVIEPQRGGPAAVVITW